MLATAACASGAEGLRFESAGARAGIPATLGGSDFHQAEAFANWNLPWGWDFGTDWRLQSRLDLSAGWVGDSDHDAAVFTFGPSLVLSRERSPVSLDVGLSPTYITHQDFEDKKFGIPLQFTSHIGLNVDVWSHLRVGYRYQHMSNAGFSKYNPGLNLHMFGVSYVF